MSTMIARPSTDEHVAYYGKYIARVPDGDLLELMRAQIEETAALLRGVPANRSDFAYGPGKWTVKQVVQHVSDVERVMGYRALRFARNDRTELPGFDENRWAENADVSGRSLNDLIEELEVIRSGTIHFAKHLSGEEQARRGKANGQEVSVRALIYIIAGHERHHVGLLRERYLS
jgi:hypothetical protein